VSSVALGLAAAVCATALYGSAPAAQAVAATRAPAGRGVVLMLRLVRQPIWLVGIGCEIAAFLLEAFAFSKAPTTLVAPVVACDMLVFVFLSRLAFGRRLTARPVAGSVAMACGIVILGAAFGRAASLGRPASSLQLWAFLAVAAVAGGVAALIDRAKPALAAAVFGSAAGVAYGFATLATRQIGRTFSIDEPLRLLATPTPYVLAGCSIIAITLMQRGLQASPALAFPLVSALSALLPVVLGAAALHDPVPGGGARLAFAVALSLVIAGVALVGGDRPATVRSPARDAS
jgi:drug/metabolite transporter (DMT)-like permease